MSGKDRVTVVAQDGESREYTVNQDGGVNAWAGQFLAEHGGFVDLSVPVATPVSCFCDSDAKGGFACEWGSGE